MDELLNTDTVQIYVQCTSPWCGAVFNHPDWPAGQRLSERSCPDCDHDCVFERSDLRTSTVKENTR